jgi:hypothetical protein
MIISCFKFVFSGLPKIIYTYVRVLKQFCYDIFCYNWMSLFVAICQLTTKTMENKVVDENTIKSIKKKTSRD